MPLYRLTYLREGKCVKTTFAQPSFELANQWAERFTHGLGELVELHEVASKQKPRQLELI